MIVDQVSAGCITASDTASHELSSGVDLILSSTRQLVKYCSRIVALHHSMTLSSVTPSVTSHHEDDCSSSCHDSFQGDSSLCTTLSRVISPLIVTTLLLVKLLTEREHVTSQHDSQQGDSPPEVTT